MYKRRICAAANEFGMMKKEKPKKNTALQIEAAVAGLCNRSYTNE